MNRRGSCVVLAVLSSVASAQSHDGPRTHKPAPTSAEISVADVMTREYIIADDSMEGRNTGRRGGLRSANYIAAELRRMGLEPAGDNGTYFQRIPWFAQRVDPANTLRIGTDAVSADDFVLVPRIGFAVQIGGQPFGRAFRGENIETVFGGVLGDSATVAPDAVRGKIVVFAPSSATGGRGGGRGGFQFWQRDNLRRYRDARAIFVATLDLAAPQQLAQYRGTRETFDDSTLTGDATPLSVISITAAAAERIFGKPLATLSAGATGQRVSGSIRFVNEPTEAPAYNVVGILRGRDVKLRNTYVAVGAHHDHVGMGPVVDHDSIRAFNDVVRKLGGDAPQPRNVTEDQWTRIRAIIDSLHRLHGGPRPDSIFNGADDDGSGTVMALEIAEALAPAANRPARSVLFVFHTAEEKGLYGAQYYSDHPSVPRDSIIAQVNLDQMGRGDPEDDPPSGPNALVLIGSKRRSPEFGELVERVNSRPEYGFRLDYAFDAPAEPSNGWCRSDHYMYARYGIPVVFFVSAVSYRDLHMVTDEPQYIAYDRMTRITRYARDFVTVVASLDHRPVTRQATPDPNARCVQ